MFSDQFFENTRSQEFAKRSKIPAVGKVGTFRLPHISAFPGIGFVCQVNLFDVGDRGVHQVLGKKKSPRLADTLWRVVQWWSATQNLFHKLSLKYCKDATWCYTTVISCFVATSLTNCNYKWLLQLVGVVPFAL